MTRALAENGARLGARMREELEHAVAEPVGIDSAIAQTLAWERANPPAKPLAAIDYAAEDAAIASTLR